jgi:hypothetical protein
LDILADPLAIIELAGIEASLTIRADKVRLSREPLMARGCDVHNVPEIVPEGRLGIGPAEFPAAVHPFAVIPDVEGQRANGGGHALAFASAAHLWKWNRSGMTSP